MKNIRVLEDFLANVLTTYSSCTNILSVLSLIQNSHKIERKKSI